MKTINWGECVICGHKTNNQEKFEQYEFCHEECFSDYKFEQISE